MKRSLLFLAFALATSPLVHAAQDGDLGTESNGEIGVSVNLVAAAKQISITGLRDIQFDKAIGDAAIPEQTVAACVYMDEAGLFSIEADAGALTSGNQHYPYSVEITQQIATGPTINMIVTDDTVEANASGFTPSTETGCGTDGNLMIKFTDTGANVLDEPFSASAIVYLKVIPD